MNELLNPLAEYINDDTVTDILINGTDSVWVENSTGLNKIALSLGNANELKEFAQKLALLGKKRLDDAMPSVDANLPENIRLHVVLEPISQNGPLISLRILRNKTFSLDDLEHKGTITNKIKCALRDIVKNKKNILISGATGSGKTTLLTALLNEVSYSQRIILIEEAFEINTNHMHVARMQTKLPNSEGTGEFTLSKLIKQSLRMRPDRIVLGECRGAEVREVLMALNTGHEGSMATIHSNSASDVASRLVALGSLANMKPESVSIMSKSAIDNVIHIKRDTKNKGIRIVDSISKIVLNGTEMEIVKVL
jgi:pilus assembly protein CpaF